MTRDTVRGRLDRTLDLPVSGEGLGGYSRPEVGTGSEDTLSRERSVETPILLFGRKESRGSHPPKVEDDHRPPVLSPTFLGTLLINPSGLGLSAGHEFKVKTTRWDRFDEGERLGQGANVLPRVCV